MGATTAVSAVRWVWDRLFGPPRVREMPDGTVRVRLLGRMHEANDYDGLFRSVSHERERLLQAVGKMREGTSLRPYHAMSRISAGDIYQRDLQRLEDRLSVYNDFLGHLVSVMQRQN